MFPADTFAENQDGGRYRWERQKTQLWVWVNNTVKTNSSLNN